MFSYGFPKHWSTLRKLLWLKLLQGAAAVVETITGTLPLTLANALSHAILSLTRYGKCEQRNLPSGYTQLDYIEGDGTAYIDTGVLLSNTDVFEITFQSLNVLASPVMGAISGGTSYTSTNNLSVTYTINTGLSAYSVYCDGAAGDANYSWNGGNRADGLKHTIKYNGLNIAPMLDGVAMTQVTSHTLVENTPTVTTWLFGRNSTSTGTLAQSGVRIFDFNIQGKGHFIPAKRNSDDVLGMYDLVSGQFLTNAGTGSFTAGPDATPTPTPDAPVDIVTNNGTIKLRRPSGMPIAYQMVEWLKPTGTIPITGFKTKSTQEIETVFYREQSGASYLYSSDTATSGTTNTTAYLTAGAGNWRWDGKSYSIGVWAGRIITSIQNKDGVWFNGTQYGYYTDPGDFVSTNDLRLSSNENTTVRIYSMTIREGETVTLDLVPVQRVTDNAYGFYDKVSGNFYTNAGATFGVGPVIDDPVEIYTDGTPEVLTVSGKNLYNKADGVLNGYPSATGTWNGRSGDTSELSIIVTLEEGKTYTAQRASGGNCPFRVMGSANRPLTNGQSLQVISAPSATTYNETTFTVPSGYPHIVFYVRNNAGSTLTIDDVVNAFQVELGSIATAYEPYVTPQTVTDIPMLLGVGDYKDEVELIAGPLTHKVGVYVFTGQETVNKGQNVFTVDNLLNFPTNSFTPFCTRYEAILSTSSPATDSNKMRMYVTQAQIRRIGFSAVRADYETGADLAAEWARWYAEGNPMILVYPLATETTEQTTPHHLVTHGGTNIVDSTANVGPVEAKVEYMKAA